jgi:hypothetical protein
MEEIFSLKRRSTFNRPHGVTAEGTYRWEKFRPWIEHCGMEMDTTRKTQRLRFRNVNGPECTKLDTERNYFCMLGPTEQVPPDDGDIIQSPKRRVLNKRQDDG